MRFFGSKKPLLALSEEQISNLERAGFTPSDRFNRHESVSHPKHYTSHPSGIECIQVTEHMGFNLGNALKYIWRCDLKRDAIEDLREAAWYIDREIQLRERHQPTEKGEL